VGRVNIQEVDVTNERHQLAIHVKNDLVLDAGWWEHMVDEDGDPIRVVHPPSVPMFKQAITYLEQQPLTSFPQPPGTRIAREARAVVALCIRWGSYFSVLTDHTKPYVEIKSTAGTAPYSVISDGEMHRMNLESSAALTWLIDLMRSDLYRYWDLVDRAYWLPLPARRLHLEHDWRAVMERLVDLSIPEATLWATNLEDTPYRRSVKDAVRTHPTRTLANLLILGCWRNNAIEDLHATRATWRPLTTRRIQLADERTLHAACIPRFHQLLLRVVYGLATEESARTWEERVLPLAFGPIYFPHNWSLTETAVDFTLWGAEERP
jgi:hypothetical protein